MIIYNNTAALRFRPFNGVVIPAILNSQSREETFLIYQFASTTKQELSVSPASQVFLNRYHLYLLNTYVQVNNGISHGEMPLKRSTFYFDGRYAYASSSCELKPEKHPD